MSHPAHSARLKLQVDSTWKRYKHSQRRRRRPGLEALESRALLSTLTVTNIADSGSGSLRAEIAAADSGDTIVFSSKLNGRVITLTSGELVVKKSLSIQGLGEKQLAVSGGGSSRLLDISSGATVSISGLTLTDGTADNGGAIDNEAGSTLTITACTLSDNGARGGTDGNALGGAIENGIGAILTVTGTAFSANQTKAVNESYGGAIYNQGSASIRSSTFSGNQALGSQTSFDGFPLPGGSLGGAIMNDDGAAMTVSQSSFADNAALGASGGDALGGAIDNESASASLGVTSSISSSTFIANQAITGANAGNGNQGGFGGAIEDLPGTTITVTGSGFTKNLAAAGQPENSGASSYAAGGAIDNGASSFNFLSINLSVNACSFQGNVASGGLAVAGGLGNFAYGGAVNFNLFGAFGGSASFTDSAFTGNQAVGQSATDGQSVAGLGGPGSGGAIFAGSPISVTKCALVANVAQADPRTAVLDMAKAAPLMLSMGSRLPVVW